MRLGHIGAVGNTSGLGPSTAADSYSAMTAVVGRVKEREIVVVISSASLRGRCPVFV
jgi:hypothetical protein